MAIRDCDPRNGGKMSGCLSSKFCSISMAWVQLILYILNFVALVFKPSSHTTVVKDMSTTESVIAGLLSLISIMFSVLLLLGLHKGRRLFVKMYCIYIVVYLVLVVFALVTNIFVQPQRLGFQGFFYVILGLLIHLLYFFVIRGYYLMTYCNNSPQQFSNQAKV